MLIHYDIMQKSLDFAEPQQTKSDSILAAFKRAAAYRRRLSCVLRRDESITRSVRCNRDRGPGGRCRCLLVRNSRTGRISLTGLGGWGRGVPAFHKAVKAPPRRAATRPRTAHTGQGQQGSTVPSHRDPFAMPMPSSSFHNKLLVSGGSV